MSREVFLIIEDQKSIALLLKTELAKHIDLPIIVCHSLAEAKHQLKDGLKVAVCLSDLNLPDAYEGEAIEILQKRNIATVVLTGSYSEETRQKMFRQKVADYVIKDSPASIHYAVNTAVNLYKNTKRNIWILTSGQTNLSARLVGLLQIHRFQVRVFENPLILLKALKNQQPELILLEDAHNLRAGDIYEFVKTVRSGYSQNQLPMIACESSAQISKAIKMMKYGVNDFFNSSFTAEELYVRVNQNIKEAEAFREIERISQTDALTGVYNRGYFFHKGAELFRQLKQQGQYFFVIMADIDHFKAVNDNHGHQKGDEAIIFTSQQVQSTFNEHLVARFGGEEFCVIGKVEDATETEALCEQLRSRIEQESGNITGVNFTISIGLTYSGNSLEEAISKADAALYQSKENGRNRISIEF